jgi:hypothetical protein
VTPAVFYKFGRKAAEKYIKREQTDPLDAIPALVQTKLAEDRALTVP